MAAAGWGQLLQQLLLLSLQLLGDRVEARQTFSRQPADVVARLGDTVILPCRVEGKTGELQWTRDQFGLGQTRDLPGFPRMTMVGEDPVKDWNLQISAAQIVDEGVYQCQVLASSSDPPIRSHTARLVVVIPSGPPRIDSSPIVTMVAGRETTVQCTAKGGKPAVQLDWEAGDVRVTDVKTWVEKIQGSVTFQTTSLMRLVPRKEDDNKEVVCRSSSPGTETSRARVRLRVEFPPEVKVRVAGGERPLEAGGEVTLECHVSAKPREGGVVWSVGGREVPGERQELLVLRRLNSSHDNTEVSCTATNSLGSTTGSLQLTVQYPPKMTVHPKSVRAVLGSQVTLHCAASGRPTPTYSWSHTGTLGVVGEGPTHTVTMGPTTAGEYYCTARGLAGHTTTSRPAVLEAFMGPRVVSPTVQTGGEGGEASIYCTFQTYNQEHIIVSWSYADNLIIPGGRYSVETLAKNGELESLLRFPMVGEEDYGEYRCTAQWEGGRVEGRVELVHNTQGEMVVLQVVLSSIGLLTCLLCLLAAVRLGQGIRQGLESEVQAAIQEKEAIYEEMPEMQTLSTKDSGDSYSINMLPRSQQYLPPTKPNHQYSTLTKPNHYHEHNIGPVLQSIDRDYAAFYGNPHLSSHLLGNED